MRRVPSEAHSTGRRARERERSVLDDRLSRFPMNILDFCSRRSLQEVSIVSETVRIVVEVVGVNTEKIRFRFQIRENVSGPRFNQTRTRG